MLLEYAGVINEVSDLRIEQPARSGPPGTCWARAGVDAPTEMVNVRDGVVNG